MNVWLLHVGEDLPIDPGGRPYRYGRLARALCDQGCGVVRWAPTIHHATKRRRATGHQRVRVDERFELRLIDAPGYRRNVGLARWRSYRAVTNRFRRLAESAERPDLIVAAIPTPSWCSAAIDYGESHDVPVVIDVRDLWPDVYLCALPRAARPAGRLALAPAFNKAAEVCRRANAVTAVSDSYLEWAMRLGRRVRRPIDRPFALGHDPVSLAEHERLDEERRLQDLGVDPHKSICAYAGLFETSYDLSTVIAAARRLEGEGRDDIQFVLCGDGGQTPKLRREAAGLRNVVFPGWVAPKTIAALMGWAKIGLVAYADDALQSLPNKPFEYMAGRLALASSLGGELATLIDEHRIGFSYNAGDDAGLARSIATLLGDPQRLESMRSRSLACFRDRFDSSAIYPEFAAHLMSFADAYHRNPRQLAA